MEVQFGGQAPKDPVSSPVVAPAAEIAALTKKIEEEGLRKGEQDLREEQLAEMMVTNPFEYERLMASGELDEDDGE